MHQQPCKSRRAIPIGTAGLMKTSCAKHGKGWPQLVVREPSAGTGPNNAENSEPFRETSGILPCSVGFRETSAGTLKSDNSGLHSRKSSRQLHATAALNLRSQKDMHLHARSEPFFKEASQQQSGLTCRKRGTRGTSGKTVKCLCRRQSSASSWTS